MYLTDKEKFELVLKHRKKNINSFCKEFGFPTATFYNLKNGIIPELSRDVWTAILKRYTEFEANWVFLNEGQMLKSDITEKKTTDTDETAWPKMGLYFQSNLVYLIAQQAALSANLTLHYGISPDYLTRLVSGAVMPSVPLLIQLREATSIGIDDLLFTDLTLISMEEFDALKNKEKALHAVQKEIARAEQQVNQLEKTIEAINRSLEDKLKALEERLEDKIKNK